MAKKKISFEEAINKLENIVSQMENDELNIDKSIDLYKEGIELAVFCGESLKKYEEDIFILKKTSENIFSEEVFKN